jgi:hypothetical protein
MDGQRQRSVRRRRRKARNNGREKSDVILIAARRPNSPVLPGTRGRSGIAASASPQRQARVGAGLLPAPTPSLPLTPARSAAESRRSARIIRLEVGGHDDVERQRQRLIDRLLTSEGRAAISRAADEYRGAGFKFPVEQEVQLKLLEHLDENCAREAIETLKALLENERPIKKPVFEQRLRRLEEYGEEAATRDAAASLRRTIRW